jgi:hypothetical protein
VRALETGKKASHWQPFLSCFEAGANDFYMIRQYMYIIYPVLSKSAKNNFQIV